MSKPYLYFDRNGDVSPQRVLEDQISRLCLDIKRDMLAARYWKVIRDTPAVYKTERQAERFVRISVQRARENHHALLRVLRELKGLRP